jgi:hypothetical protein
VLLTLLWLSGAVYLVAMFRAARAKGQLSLNLESIGLGAVTNFFDTLGMPGGGIALGGIPAVLIAAYAVTSMPLVYLRWGVVAVVLYAAVVLLRAALQPTAVLC